MNKVQQGIELVSEMSDDELNRLVDYIRQEYKNRKHLKAAKARAALKLHDRVIITGTTKPQYLSGMTGTLEEFRDSRVTVKLDSGPVGKFRNGRVVCSPAMLEKIG